MGHDDRANIILSDRIDGASHGMPEAWLRARVRGWMERHESPGMAFWIGAYADSGKWIFCSSAKDTYRPARELMKYAQDVCRHLNRECSGGGAWLAGWIRHGHEFYLLWKDSDGDIQIPIEANKPWIVLRNYTLDDWLKHATAALGVWSEWKKNMDLGKGQTVKLAQGQQPTQGHGKFVPPVAP
jgi:hypothetical protein